MNNSSFEFLVTLLLLKQRMTYLVYFVFVCFVDNPQGIPPPPQWPPLGPNCLANWLANQNVVFLDRTKTTWLLNFQWQQKHMKRDTMLTKHYLFIEAWHNADEALLVYWSVTQCWRNITCSQLRQSCQKCQYWHHVYVLVSCDLLTLGESSESKKWSAAWKVSLKIPWLAHTRLDSLCSKIS